MPERWHVPQLLPSILLAAAASTMTALSPSEVTVVEILRPEVSSASLRLQVYSGSAEDPAGKEGLASLTAAMLRQEAAERAGDLDGRIEATVGKDVTVFTVETAVPTLGRWLEVLRAVMVKPAMEPAMFASQRAIQERFLESARSDAATLSREAFDAFVFRGHPYAHAAAGKTAALVGLSRDDLAAYHAAQYRKGNIAVGIAGGMKESWVETIRNDLAALPDGEPSRGPRPVAWLAHPRALVVQDSAMTSVRVRIGHPLNITRAHPDHVALALVCDALRAALPGVEILLETDDAGAMALPRRQQAFVMMLDAPTAAEAARATRAALVRMEEAARSGTGVSLLDQAVPRAETIPIAAGDLHHELPVRLDQLLWRIPGLSSRLISSLQAVTAQTARETAARALFPDRVAIVAVAPDSRAFTEALIEAGPGPTLTRDDIETLDPAELFH